LAHDLAARMKYSNRSLRAAGQQVIHEYLAEAGGAGGLIAIDPRGHIIMPFNTAGMFRGHLRAGEEPVIQFFGAE
jgi:beta-aspartyl-peptidase (threonine type)